MLNYDDRYTFCNDDLYMEQLERRRELRKNLSFIRLYPRCIKHFMIDYGWY